MPGFQASVDWYKIKIVDSITTPGAQTLIDQCNAGDQDILRDNHRSTAVQ